MEYSKPMYFGPSLDKAIECLQFGDRYGALQHMLNDMTCDDGQCGHEPDPDTFEICDIDGVQFIEYEDGFVIRARKERAARGKDGDGI